MSVTCLNPVRFIEGLDIETLCDQKIFDAAVAACEESYESDPEQDRAYWDGSPWDERRSEIGRLRRRIEDRLRKDEMAVLRAFIALK